MTTESESVYDEDNNEIEDIETSGEITKTTANEYDAMGNQIRTAASDGTVTEITYDSMNRLLTKTIAKDGKMEDKNAQLLDLHNKRKILRRLLRRNAICL